MSIEMSMRPQLSVGEDQTDLSEEAIKSRLEARGFRRGMFHKETGPGSPTRLSSSTFDILGPQVIDAIETMDDIELTAMQLKVSHAMANVSLDMVLALYPDEFDSLATFARGDGFVTVSFTTPFLEPGDQAVSGRRIIPGGRGLALRLQPVNGRKQPNSISHNTILDVGIDTLHRETK